MGRQEKPLADPRSPQGALAAFLRTLRIEAELTYTEMGTGVLSAVSTLSKAASGDTVPSLATVRDYITACRLDDPARETALKRAEALWRNAVLHARGITHPAGMTGLPGDRARTPGQFAEAVTALLGSCGLFALRDIEDATDKAGCRIPRSTLARLLDRDARTVMSSAVLDVLLHVCEIRDEIRRKAWTAARTQAALAAAGLTDHGFIQVSGQATADRVTAIGSISGPVVYRAGTTVNLRGIVEYPHDDVARDVVPRVGDGAEVIISPDGTVTSLHSAVVKDLERLCRGDGVYATSSVLGPALYSLLNQLTQGVGEGSERQRLISLIDNASAQLPPHLRTIFLTAANFRTPEARSPHLPSPNAPTTLQMRLEALALDQQVDIRTMRRRLHHAAQLLAEQLLVDYQRAKSSRPTR